MLILSDLNVRIGNIIIIIIIIPSLFFCLTSCVLGSYNPMSCSEGDLLLPWPVVFRIQKPPPKAAMERTLQHDTKIPKHQVRTVIEKIVAQILWLDKPLRVIHSSTNVKCFKGYG